MDAILCRKRPFSHSLTKNSLCTSGKNGKIKNLNHKNILKMVCINEV